MKKLMLITGFMAQLSEEGLIADGAKRLNHDIKLTKMKTQRIITILLFIGFFLSINTMKAEWVVDHAYKFKIDIPSDWSSSSYMDGTDKVYDFYSPDENIAIQLRAFEAGAGVTNDLLAQVFEQNVLPSGSKKQDLFDHTSKNGIPGKLGVYSAQYNSIEIAISVFYTIQNGYGYALMVIVPSNMLEQKSPEIKAVTRTFMIEGFGSDSNIASQKKKPSGLSGLVGGVSQSSGTGDVSAKNIVGRYNFIKRSDGKSLLNYHYIDIKSNGTYSEKYQPKDSPNYQGGQDGTWKVNGNTLTLTHSGGITDTYTIRGNELIRVSDDGTSFTFRK